jgi:ribosomal protein L18
MKIKKNISQKCTLSFKLVSYHALSKMWVQIYKSKLSVSFVWAQTVSEEHRRCAKISAERNIGIGHWRY